MAESEFLGLGFSGENAPFSPPSERHVPGPKEKDRKRERVRCEEGQTNAGENCMRRVIAENGDYL